MESRIQDFIRETAPNGFRVVIILLVLLTSSIVPYNVPGEILPVVFLVLGGILAIFVYFRWPESGFIVLSLSGMFIHQTGPGGLNITLIIVCVLALLWVGRMIIFQQTLSIIPSSIMIPVLAMGVSATIAFGMGQIPWFPFAGNAPLVAQIGGYAVYVLSLSAFFLTANQIKDIRWLKRLVSVFIFAGAFYTLGVINPVINLFTTETMVDLRGLFWIWLIALAYSQAAFNRDLHPVWRILLFVLVLTILYILYVVRYKSKSGWLPVFIVIWVITALRSWRLAGILVIGGIFIIISILPDMLSSEDYSLATRLEALPIMFQVLRVNPIFGVGFANYYWYTPLFPIRGYYVSFSSHNNYADIMVQTGVSGLFFYTWLVVQVGAMALRLRKRVTGGFELAYINGALGGLVGMIVIGFLGDWVLPFVYNIGLWGFRSSVQGWLFLGGLVALQQIVDAKLHKEPPARYNSKPTLQIDLELRQMIIITESAQKGLMKILEEKGAGKLLGLRLAIRGGAPGAYQSDFRLVRPGDERPDDIILDQGDFQIYIDADSVPKLKGATIDFVPTFRGPSFKIEYPQPKWDDPLAQKVQDLLSERVNPGVASHGGYVTLLGVKDRDVFLELGGGCQGCTMSAATLRQGIEILMREEIPEIEHIIDQTDHEAGTNPYYSASDLGKQAVKSPLVEDAK